MKFDVAHNAAILCGLPSCEGSGLKSLREYRRGHCLCLPSHEGSGLKCVFAGVLQPHRRLPSYEGSGLKFPRGLRAIIRNCLPSHEGSGLKSNPLIAAAQKLYGLPSHEGSGLKLRLNGVLCADGGLPSHEGSGLKWYVG